MAKIDLIYGIKNYTPATATAVDENFNTIENHINQEVIERDGTVAMRAQLKLAGNPVADLDAASKQYVDQVMPIGIIMMYGGAGAPPGGSWLPCQGQELQTSQYQDLYHEIGHNFSPANTPASRFNLPNLQDRVPMGKGTKTSMGETGGRRDTVLPKHTHGMKNHTHGMRNHTHPIDHDHPNSTTGDAGDHGHGMSAPVNVAIQATGTDYNTSSAPPTTGRQFKQFQLSGDHHHSVNVAPQNKANSGWPSDNDSGGPSDNTTGEAGSDPSDDNLPPFQGVQFIIRVK